MGKLDVSILRHLTKEDFRVLAAIETCMNNHELTPAAAVAAQAKLRHGGMHKILKDLCKHRLLTYERGRKFDGYRLTNMGFDYLAIHELTQRNVISSFGSQIGVGKESNIYMVANPENEELCLKLHRLGRTCFRNVKNMRDYHRHGKHANWLQLSKVSAAKEFTYMTVLYDRNFPIPEPIKHNRHCVIMKFIEGIPLANVKQVKDVETLYDELMNLIVKLANSGVIHCDFNEFNIMLNEDESPVIIDFPQIVSILHDDAEMLFNRDVNCIREFFKRRFGFESEDYPKFSDIERMDNMDEEMRCSGFKKQKLKDSEDNAYTDSENDDINVSYNDEISDSENDENFEMETRESENNIENEEPADNVIETVDEYSTQNTELIVSRTSSSISENKEHANNVIETNDENSTEKTEIRVPSVHGCITDFSNYRSRSIMSTTSTIPPDKIQKQVNEENQKKIQKEKRKRCVAKGEASARTRTRRENANTIKFSSGIWG